GPSAASSWSLRRLLRVAVEDGADRAEPFGRDAADKHAGLLHRRLEVADRRAEERAALDDRRPHRSLVLQFLQVDDVVVVPGPQLEDARRLFGAGEFFLDEHRQFAAADPRVAGLGDLHLVAADEAPGGAPTFLGLAAGKRQGGHGKGSQENDCTEGGDTASHLLQRLLSAPVRPYLRLGTVDCVWRWLSADPREVVDLAGAGTLAAGVEDRHLGEELRRWRGIVARRRLVALARRHAAVALALAAMLEVLALLGLFPQSVVVAVPLALFIVSIAVFASRGPSPFGLARLLDDKLGLNDRLATALEIEARGGQESPLERRTVADAAGLLAAGREDWHASAARAGRYDWSVLGGVVLALAVVVAIGL